ncbi:hypothetical protein N3K66_002730 [Trichothecium roseum]|uniref:Uncharacterized protein n=1 Tax=Trichothecium roseum TaxID=47278 RepID=A0ACC0VC81_9HYPO|nr:hypothetical protein N3K66_002730 [Trichothecium roseum]
MPVETMSSLARTRSLRKPSTTTAANTITRSRAGTTKGSAEPRNASPSRLPIKPHTRSASTTVASGIARGTRTVSTTVSRAAPSSTTTTTTATTTRQTRANSSAAQDATTKRSLTRVPSSATLSRQTTNGARPTSSEIGAAAQTRRAAATHTRAKSTATPTSLNSSTVLRPPSGASSTTTNGGGKPAHARATSADKPTRAAATAAAQAPAAVPNSAATAAATTQPAARAQPKLRPAFSTLQQHYSPAKSSAPKPLTSTFLAPPSPSKLPANLAASAENGRLQATLLQLHLLHRDAAQVHGQWQVSAKDKLGRRFAELCDMSEHVASEERAGVERESVLALRGWGGASGLGERVQALDAVVSGVWALGEPGGRYARIVRRFERWLDQVSELEEGRRAGTTGLQGALFVEELDASWKEDLDGTVRKLDGWRRKLDEMGVVPAASGDRGEGEEDGEEEEQRMPALAHMLDGCRAMVGSMRAELSFMEDFELEAKAREEAWIESMVRENDDGGGGIDGNIPGAGAVWRVA